MRPMERAVSRKVKVQAISNPVIRVEIIRVAAIKVVAIEETVIRTERVITKMRWQVKNSICPDGCGLSSSL